MLWYDLDSKLNKILKSKTSIFSNNFLCNSFKKNFGSIFSDLLNDFFSNHVIGFLTLTCAKVRFWVGIGFHPNLSLTLARVGLRMSKLGLTRPN